MFDSAIKVPMINGGFKMPEMKEPSLSREIGRVAWLMAKLLVSLALLIGLLYFLLPSHPIIAAWILSGLMVAGQIVFYGWQNYKWKKENWEREQKEERERTARIADSQDQNIR
jgi:type VI protein secretion system component VasK